MTQQNMTEEETKAIAELVGSLVARSQKPLQYEGWLLKLPEADVISHTTTLVKDLPAGWLDRVQDLQCKMFAWLEAKKAEAAAEDSISALRQRKAETEQASQDNRARFREMLEQNGGTVTPEMKALRAEYLEQQEAASDLTGLIAEREKQLPALADATGRKANAYVFCHDSIMDERIDTLIDEFFMVNGVELGSLFRMKYSQFERNGSVHAAGVIEGANDADTLYRKFAVNLIEKWTHKNLPLMFRDNVISLTGAYPVRGARTDRRKRKIF